MVEGGLMPLVEMVRKYGVGGKLKQAVIAERGWRRPDFRTGDAGEWYERWPVFAAELEAAVTTVRAEDSA